MNFLRLRRTPKLAVPKHETDTFFVDQDGVFKKMAPDGTVSEVGGDGGGGSLPSDWSVTGSHEITSSAEVTFAVTGGSQTGVEYDADTGAKIRMLQAGNDLFDVVSQQGNEMLGVGETDAFFALGDGTNPGNLLVTPNDFSAQGSTPLVQLGSGGGAKFFRSGQVKLQPGFDESTTPTLDVTGFDVAPALIIRTANIEPADSFFGAGDFALWFDSTNGAAKLMVKAKQADGTVVTGELALA